MEMKVEFLRKCNKSSEIEQIVREAFLNHPFFAGNVSKPNSLLVKIGVTLFEDKAYRENVTSINHDNFLTDGFVHLNLHWQETYKLIPFNEIPDYSSLNDKLFNTISHEFGHFIDARLNKEFGYKDDLLPLEGLLRRVHHDLWNSFIDGRLGVLAPYTLEERMKDAREINKINTSFIREAWYDGFKTYEHLLERAHAACESRQ